MNKLLMILFTFFLLSNASCQHKSTPLSEIHLAPESGQAKVLLVGTWHFRYPGLDAHKTSEEDKVNVLLPHRQKEMKELVDYIARFKPTKVVVEAGRNTGYLIHRKKEVDSGETKRRAGEIDQIAFRLMDQFNLDTIYGCDSYGLSLEWGRFGKDTATMKLILEEKFSDYDYSSDDPWDAKYDGYYAAGDKYSVGHTLLESFKEFNRPENIAADGGAYLVGDFKLGDYRGTDAYLLNWYSRNLRIFRNIQNITSMDDRIMVLFGSGHMTILHELFGNSPEYDVIHFGDLED